MPEQITDQDREDGKALIADLDIIITTFNDLPEKVQSKYGKELISEFLEQITPRFKHIKAQLLVDFDLV